MTQKALASTFWTSGDAVLRLVLKLVISVTLARLLSPVEFGTIALLYIFIDIGYKFVDSGFSAALIQSQHVTHADESTVFWFNVLAGSGAAALLAAAAPFIARFFSVPVLAPLTRLMALSIFIGALGSIHNTLLTKALHFRIQMQVGAASTIVSGIVAILLAWCNYGVWALAIQAILGNGLTTILFWIFNPWRPSFRFSREAVRRFFGFGGFIFLSGLIDSAYRRSYAVLIGKWYSLSEVGFYNRAYETQQSPASTLTDVVTRVAFPIFSAAAADKEQLRRGVRLAISTTMLINVAIMFGLAAVAQPLVLTVFGTKWLPAVPVLQVLCFAGVLWPLHSINLNVLMALGHSNLFFRLEVLKKSLGIGLLVIASLWGIMAIAWAQVLYSVLVLAINAHYTKRFLDYGILAQCRDFLPAVATALPMTLGVLWLHGKLSSSAPIVSLVSLSAVGASIFLTIGWVSRLNALQNIVNLVQKRRAAVPKYASAY